MRTYEFPSVTLTSYTGGGEGNKPVSSPFGPVRAGLTTLQRTNRDLQLLELLSYLERQAEILENKSLRVLDISLADTTHLAEPTDIACEQAGIELE